MLSDRFIDISKELPKGVNLLAVTKGQSISTIRTILDFGGCNFGESRLQEALPKIESLKQIDGLHWHFIGRLQANKVRGVVRSFEYIHSVDSLSLAERISRIAGEEKLSPQVMLQVKFREDPSKGGFSPSNLLEVWPQLIALPHWRIVGLMTIPPLDIELANRRSLFYECRKLANKLNLPHCSMGMSSDWEEAIEAGATWLRLGSILFEEQ